MAKSSVASKAAPKKVTSLKSKPSDFAPAKSSIAATSPGKEDGLVKLFMNSIKDIYWAENTLVKTLPKMSKAAWSPDLKKAIDDHLQKTKGHVSRLEEVFKLLGKDPEARKCDAMEGITKEGEGGIESTDKDTPARDLGIITASQKVEHYEMVSYIRLSSLANALNHKNISELFEQTLAEEKEADQMLDDMAVNFAATYNKA